MTNEPTIAAMLDWLKLRVSPTCRRSQSSGLVLANSGGSCSD